MPGFRRRGMGMRPVHRIKHVIDKQAGVVLNVQNSTILAVAVDAPTLATSNEVETGSTINGIYLKVEVSASTAGALANVYLSVEKNPGNNLVMPAPNNVGSNENKKWIIHQEMIMLQQNSASNPRTLFNGVIVIPRGYRRQAIGDIINARVFAPGVNINLCLQCHYKEFR